ncbi:protein CPR-5-like [Miscanthus floridulus]|uniref:protein CPR-5-like n=1 Tax=Miscanthus floridulus TaxID=154761 RepID=UPI00345A6B17
MDGAHIAAASLEAGGASSSASSASSYGGSASGRSWLRKGVHLRRRRRRVVAVKGGERAGGGDVQDLALPFGMSFAAVLAQVLNRCSGSEGRLGPDVLSKMCTSAVKESLTNIYGDKFQSFMSNFEKAFGSTLRTIHLINETPVYEQDMAQCSYKDGNSVPDEIKLGGADSLPEIKLGGADSQSQIHDVQADMPPSSMNNQIVLHTGVNHQLVHLTRSRSNPEIDQHILSVFERSLNEQARSNELKELVIGLTMRKLQLSRSQLALSSDSHMLEKIKVRMGFQKASFKEKKFKTEMEDTKHAELFRKLIDMLLTAVVLMSVCFGYGTCIYSYQRITAATSACAAISREYTSWWMPSSVSAFNSGLLLFKCHVIAATRIFFGILMLLLIGWLIFQRSTMTGPNMPLTFNVMILGVLCGYFGSRCLWLLGVQW